MTRVVCFRLFFRACFHTHKMPVVHKESDNRLNDFSVVYKIWLLRTALKISACNSEPQTSLWRTRYLFLKPVTLGFLHESREHVSGQKDRVVVEKLQNKLSRLDIIGSNISICRRKFSRLIVINQTPQASNSTGWNGKI